MLCKSNLKIQKILGICIRSFFSQNTSLFIDSRCTLLLIHTFMAGINRDRYCGLPVLKMFQKFQYDFVKNGIENWPYSLKTENYFLCSLRKSCNGFFDSLIIFSCFFRPKWVMPIFMYSKSSLTFQVKIAHKLRNLTLNEEKNFQVFKFNLVFYVPVLLIHNKSKYLFLKIVSYSYK